MLFEKNWNKYLIEKVQNQTKRVEEGVSAAIIYIVLNRATHLV